MPAPEAVAGVADHAGWAVVVTVASGGKLLDRRRVELVSDGLPILPHHHEAQLLPPPEAERLIAQVQASAEQHAGAALDLLAAEVSLPIGAIALRRCPPLPPTVAERIADYRAQTVADTVMYREALAGAAAQRGWTVHWYDRKIVVSQAGEALGGIDIEQLLREVRATAGPPWQADHRVAMAAAIAAGNGARR